MDFNASLLKRLPNIMQLDDKVASNTKQMANLFSKYTTFSAKEQILVLSEVTVFKNKYLSHVIFTPCNMLNVLKYLNPSKASGHDGLDTRILKKCASVFDPSLTRIFTNLFKLRKFPETWKQAKAISF